MRRPVALALSALALGAAGWGIWTLTQREAPTAFRTVELSRTRVRQVVQATGTVDAVTRVDVGTQVSGILSEVLVDFNDEVKAGQILARMDTALLTADVSAANAQLAQAQAEEALSRTVLTRMEGLLARAAATNEEVEAARAAVAVNAARVQSTRVALSRAERNLRYAIIESPIAGTILARNVEPGQTVNAGLSAPTLFVLAGDLSHMQIAALVDESDIGQVRPGMAAEFTVQAWPDEVFTGVVREVRLQSTTAENIVTYPAIIDVDNPAGRLLPGMTATVDLIVAQVDDVLCAPNAALRYAPTDDLLSERALAARAERRAGGEGGRASGSSGGGRSQEGGGARGERRGGGTGAAGEGSAAGAAPPAPSGETPAGASTGAASDATTAAASDGSGVRARGRLWVADATGRLDALPVKTGLRDATCTQVEGEGVTEGLTVVTGIQREAEPESRASSVFQGGGGGQQSRGPRPGGF